ncbi:hypothetical protein GCM10011344_24670 [Dokdonia pacifica]|uniref:DUF2975 domain-containing protein n=1 Tax=Dokdonia pacifica TaxID=1627892 RepID=A0A238WPG3_9FLAO|nr:DUF2975 domain-containing protein [Dokdonia pacifica]GGG23044.1 hypothetical protein GCM10011344_24670 [Dokdonia pacifica]SNR48442.1 Protein of unknown function [Dokdonia pacifica]
MKTQQLISILKFIFWVVFIGLLISAGVLVFTFGLGIIYPENARNIYLGLDLFKLRTTDIRAFMSVGSLSITVVSMQAYIAYLAIKIATTGNLKHPFTEATAILISKISQLALSCGVISIIADRYCRRLIKKGFEADLTLGGQRIVEKFDIDFTLSGKEFLFLAAILFIIAKVFQKGIELQKENDLTV